MPTFCDTIVVKAVGELDAGGVVVGVKVRQCGIHWYVLVDHQYRKKAKKVGPGKSGFDAANQLAAQWAAQIALGVFDFGEGREVTFGDYADRWLSTYAGALKPETRDKYAEILRVHWLPALGHQAIPSITRPRLKEIVEAKLKTHARTTVTLMIDVIRGCLRAAVEDKIIQTNPAASLGKLFPNRKPRPTVTMSPGVIAVVLNELERRQSSIYAPALVIARTGLRIGEVLALRVGATANVLLTSRSKPIEFSRRWLASVTMRRGCSPDRSVLP
jgi:hypothetical protein